MYEEMVGRRWERERIEHCPRGTVQLVQAIDVRRDKQGRAVEADRDREWITRDWECGDRRARCYVEHTDILTALVGHVRARAGGIEHDPARQAPRLHRVGERRRRQVELLDPRHIDACDIDDITRACDERGSGAQRQRRDDQRVGYMNGGVGREKTALRGHHSVTTFSRGCSTRGGYANDGGIARTICDWLSWNRVAKRVEHVRSVLE